MIDLFKRNIFDFLYNFFSLAHLSKDELLMPNQDFIQNGLRSLADAMSDFDFRKKKFQRPQNPQLRIVPTTS